MQKWSKHIWDIIKGLAAWVISVGISAMIGWLAWLKEVPFYLIILVFLSALCLILFLKDKYFDKSGIRRINISKRSDKKIEKTIREWIDIPGFSVERKDEGAGILFNFLIKDRIGRTVNIIRETTNPQFINLTAKVILSNPPGGTLSDIEWRKLAGKISIELARLGIGYDFVGTPNPHEVVYLIESLILDDSLNSMFLRQKISFVIRAMILAIEIVRQFLEDIGHQP